MKNLLWFALGAGAVYLYLMNRKKKCSDSKEVLKEEIKATINSSMPRPSVNPNILKNRVTFNELRATYNDSEAATVAPSIKAPIGIF